MIEPLFGSTSQTWPAMPSPGLGWPQLMMPLGSRLLGGSTGFGSQQIPAMTTGGPAATPQLSLTPMGFGQQSLTNSLAGFSTSPSPFGVVSGALPFVSQEIVTGPTIRALLEAVAIRRGQPLGPTNDQECEDFIYDVLELLPGANEVDARCDGGRITLAGNVPNKRLKHDIGEIAWTIPGINDVQNNVTIVTRRRARGAARDESPATSPGRKTA